MSYVFLLPIAIVAVLLVFSWQRRHNPETTTLDVLLLLPLIFKNFEKRKGPRSSATLLLLLAVMFALIVAGFLINPLGRG